MYDKECIEVFLKNQRKLFLEPVAANEQEAEEFLTDIMAVLCKNKKEALDYLDETMDIIGMSEAEILSADEVFALPSGRYLIVEG